MTLWIALFVSMLAAALSPQVPGRVDFRRDVQPILRARCISCHGPDQQWGGLRLDRRADAMRGGSQSDIGPGNAEGSRLYHRLIGTRFGVQMPPTGPLDQGEIDIIKQWIDEGADWPDDVAGEVSANGGVTPLMLAVPDRAAMQRLLDAGADVNARSDEGRSALVIASGIVGAMPAVQLLLDYGADPSVWRPQEVSPLREAARVDQPDTFKLLLDYGADPRRESVLPPRFVRTACPKCAALAGFGGPLPKMPPDEMPGGSITRFYDPMKTGHPTPVGRTPATPAAIQAAVERSLPLLQQIDVAFVKQTGCVSCHHNSLVQMAVSAARAHGIAVNEDISKSQLEVIGAYLESWRVRALQNIPIAGGQDTMSYLLFGLAAERYAPDAATDAQAQWLKRRQAADGHWPLQTIRPPIESNDIEVTAVSMRALQVFAPRAQRAEYDQAIDRARAWLMKAPAASTEERAFKLLGLSWAKAPAQAIQQAARELLATQRADGGWTQVDDTPLTDAYSTGEALVALRESGSVEPANPAYTKGLEHLLATQIEDGTWFVETRAVPIQAPFASGFPYGAHQWISAAATAWATTALALAR